MDKKFRGEFRYIDKDGQLMDGFTGVKATRSDARYAMSTDRVIIKRCGGSWVQGNVVELKLTNIR